MDSTSRPRSAYRAYIARDPREPERVLVLAPFLARANRVAEAIEVLKSAWKTCRPEAVATTALALYGVPSADRSFQQQVVDWLAEASQKSSSAAPFLRVKLARIYWKRGNSDQSAALLRQILANDPDNVEALDYLAWQVAFRNPGKAGQSVELIDRAIEKAGPIPALIDTRAVALIQASQADRAVGELQTALAADPKNLSLTIHLAWAYQATGKAEEARQAFRRAEELGLKPENRDPFERAVINRLRRELTGEVAQEVKPG